MEDRTEIVAALGQIEGQRGLAHELRGHVDALVGGRMVALAQAERTSRTTRSCSSRSIWSEAKAR